MASVKNWEFPILKAKEICSTLKVLEIDLTTAQLKSPTESDVFHVYEDLLDVAGLFPRDDYRSVHPAPLQCPELLEAFPPHAVSFYYEIVHSLRKIGFMDFSIQDIVSPTCDRTIMALSAIINFARFRGECEDEYRQLNLVTTSLQEQIAQVDEAVARHEAMLRDLKRSRDEEAPAIERAQGELLSLEKEVETLKSQQADIEASARSMANEANGIAAEIKQTMKDNAAVEDSIKQLESNIIPSPGRMQKEVRDAQESADREQLEVEALRDTLRKLDIKHQAFTKVQAKLAMRLEEMEGCERQMKEVNKLEREMRKVCDSELSLGRELARLEQELKSLSNQTSTLDSRSQETAREYHRGMITAERTLKTLQEQYAATEKAVEASRASHKQNDEVMRKIAREMDVLKGEHDDLMDRCGSKVKSMDQIVALYHSRILQNIRASTKA